LTKTHSAKLGTLLPSSYSNNSEKYLDELIAIEEEEKILNQEKERNAQSEQLEKLYSAAHIPGIDKFTNDIFQLDPDFQYVLLIFGFIIRKIFPIIEENFQAFSAENLSKFNVLLYYIPL
jgi:hypothetical protein